MFHLILIVTSFFSWNASADFDWQGHRGARGLYPENTINGMKEAAKFPITTFELDVVISKDNQVVVSHEPWMNEEICLGPDGKMLKNREVNLFKLNYAQIKKYDCGSKLHPRFPQQKKIIEHKPLLSELLTELEPQKLHYNIEIKSTVEDEKAGFQPDYKSLSDLVIAEVTRRLPVARFTIQSFDWRVLQYLHKIYPDILLVALRETKYDPQQVLVELGFVPAVFAPDWEMLTAKDIEFFHGKKIKVIPWTVNTVSDMKKMIYMGVDGMITDYPNLIIEIPLDTYHLIPECPAKFNRFEGKCVRIPKHAVASSNNPGWVCNDGYLQKRDSCVKTKLPKNAEFNADGKTWSCRPGFKRYRYRCQAISP